jgi:ribose transport system substrate-binding protein
MAELRLLFAVIENNEFQKRQATAAQEAANKLGVELKVLEVEDDAISQSLGILKVIQGPLAERPHGVMFEPIGTPLEQAARAAVAAGMAWAVLNRSAIPYVTELRRSGALVFTVSASQNDIGYLQGEQMGKLLPRGGTALYIEGPSGNEACIQRFTGMQAAKPSNIEVRRQKGNWTLESGYQAVKTFLGLSTSKEARIKMVVAQNDAMALGARKAFVELTGGEERLRYMALPFLGVDGLPDFGLAAVKKQELAATVVVPPSAGQAVEAMVAALRTRRQPSERIVTQVSSYPPVNLLRSELRPMSTQSLFG